MSDTQKLRDLDEIMRGSDAATEGPLEGMSVDYGNGLVWRLKGSDSITIGDIVRREDALFFQNACTDIPPLVAALREALKKIATFEDNVHEDSRQIWAETVNKIETLEAEVAALNSENSDLITHIRCYSKKIRRGKSRYLISGCRGDCTMNAEEFENTRLRLSMGSVDSHRNPDIKTALDYIDELVGDNSALKIELKTYRDGDVGLLEEDTPTPQEIAQQRAERVATMNRASTKVRNNDPLTMKETVDLFGAHEPIKTPWWKAFAIWVRR